MTAMVTPFDANDRLDRDEAARLARYLVAAGNEALVVAGTTGESPALDDAEKIGLIETTKAAVGERAAIVAGTGGNNTRHSVALTKGAAAAGADAILAVVPYYNKPTQDGMLRHFGALAEATTLPLIVYNIPGRTAVNMQPATLMELACRYPTIVGVKESSGDLAQFTMILRDRPAGFRFWCGDDYLFLPSLALGADGLISVAAHLCAREYRDLLDAQRRGDNAAAARLHRDLAELCATLFATTSPIPVKWAMRELGFAVGECRSPLGAMPAALAERLRPQLEPYRQRVRSALAEEAAAP
ncbi:MAG: 4-hydroxy-tetrahydrodipicolinate synthase [Candidatus Eremiobacteraeota bacterium]|nr:4-hydroxy-tetrahydrodipicolinate synthase [Candidatus Eremiobacteraeota bacterium]